MKTRKLTDRQKMNEARIQVKLAIGKIPEFLIRRQTHIMLTDEKLKSPREQVLAIREALHLTQEGLARELCVGVRTVARWESGASVSFMTWLRLRGFASIRGVSVQWPWDTKGAN